MSNDDFSINAYSEKEKSGEVISLELVADKEIEMVSLQVEAEAGICGCKMLLNGFQTWSESVSTDGSLRLRNLRMLFAKVMRPYGDYFFYKFTGRKGDLHSHTYTCFTGQDGTALLVGSIDESTGYTIFQGFLEQDRLVIHKDCEGQIIKGRASILRLYAAQGNESLLFEEYLEFLGGNRRNPPKSTGWTSWYNYYTGISEKIIMDNLESIKNENIPMDFFQIDDGYQTAVGDWLSINDNFPGGMKHIADEIKARGLQPGLWLAPFVCEKNSQIFHDHPDWVLRGKSGRPVLAGWNPNWSGFYYPIDIYNEGVKRYLEMVFETVLDEWGYSMVKLDFLYAAGLQPRNGKCRAAVMIEAMDFLQYIISDKLILGCGVPLAPAFNRVDYCRIGADVAPYWEDRRLKYLRSRERVSTLGSLHNTLARYRLNGRVFLNDPDVFMLRDSDNNLNPNQRYTLFFLNNLLGGLVFTSDRMGNYDDSTLRLIKSIFPLTSPEIKQIKSSRKDFYEIEFKIGDRHYMAFSNLGGGHENVYLHLGTYFNEKDLIVQGPGKVTLGPFETKCFLKVDMDSEVVILGTTGYIFPASHIEGACLKGREISIALKKGFINTTEIYIKPFGQENELIVNGVACKVEQHGSYRLVKFKMKPEEPQ